MSDYDNYSFKPATDEFWYVYNPHANKPKFRHGSQKSALDEASRLAAYNPGEPFYVLKAEYCLIQKPRIEVQNLSEVNTVQDTKGKDTLNIGDYDKDKGIFAGYLHGKQVWVGMNDEPEQMTWDEAMNLEKSGRHVPTIDELTLAYLHKDEINQALIKHGGEAFKEDDYYWSSSECSDSYSWILYMGSGNRSSNNKTLHYYERCFQLL